MHVIAHTCKQPPQAVISMAGYGLTEKRLQPARLRNLYGGLQLTETTAAYSGLRRRLRGLVPIYTAWWQRNMGVNNLPSVVTWQRHGRELNLQPLSHQSNTLLLDYRARVIVIIITNGQRNVTKWPYSQPPHIDGLMVFAKWRLCAPHLMHASLDPPEQAWAQLKFFSGPKIFTISGHFSGHRPNATNILSQS